MNEIFNCISNHDCVQIGIGFVIGMIIHIDRKLRELRNLELDIMLSQEQLIKE